MGRYIDGDIDHKFWFGVQASDAADRFGVDHYEPNYIDYYFSESDLPGVEKELDLILALIGEDNFNKIDTFWKELEGGYNDDILKKHGMLELWNAHKVNYADYILGIKIRDCIKELGKCEFSAEL